LAFTKKIEALTGETLRPAEKRRGRMTGRVREVVV
jgi:hypothetical protein